MWPAVKRGFTQEGFSDYVKDLFWRQWRPSKIVWHNTAAPSLEQWIRSAEQDRGKGLIPGQTRIGNLENFFRSNQGWSGCPHLFIANDLIWVMNPLISPGVHSPSFNSTAIGIEMVGDFSKESPDFGPGLQVKQNTTFTTAILCSTIGIEASPDTIRLHKEDKRTTHDCPGELIAKQKLAMVKAVGDLMSGGDHHDEPIIEPWHGRVATDNLNIRSGPGVVNKSIGKLAKGTWVKVNGEAKNGTTTWLHIENGWISGSFVERTP